MSVRVCNIPAVGCHSPGRREGGMKVLYTARLDTNYCNLDSWLYANAARIEEGSGLVGQGYPTGKMGRRRKVDLGMDKQARCPLRK